LDCSTPIQNINKKKKLPLDVMRQPLFFARFFGKGYDLINKDPGRMMLFISG
jgi:hypothetical protein